jgi:hypothetical protein
VVADSGRAAYTARLFHFSEWICISQNFNDRRARAAKKENPGAMAAALSRLGLSAGIVGDLHQAEVCARQRGGDCEANEGPGKEAHIFPIFGRAFWYLPYIEPSKHTAGKCDDED